jgi:DNA-binding MarR family transcriptional regulator
MAVSSTYGEMRRLIERLARRFQETGKVQLDRQGISDLTFIQASLLRLVADGATTPRMLIARGVYVGATLTYNLTALVDNGYLSRDTRAADRRSVQLGLTQKGEQMCALLERLEAEEGAALTDLESELQLCLKILRRIESAAAAPEDRLRQFADAFKLQKGKK